MLRRTRLAVPAAAVAAITALVAAPGTASAVLNCPDGYIPFSAAAAPHVDRNGNGTICVKPTNQQPHDDPPGQTNNDFVDDL
jgi:hypothetical protein